MKKRYQVFICSTFTDLLSERQAAVEAILKAGRIPAGMELFTAGDQSQMDAIRKWIDESDIFMLILGARYGSIEPLSGLSFVPGRAMCLLAAKASGDSLPRLTKGA